MRIVYPADKNLVYCGRIDWDDELAPVFVYAATFVKIRFRGTCIKAKMKNTRAYFTNYMGVIVDGEQSRFRLRNDDEIAEYVLAEGLNDGDHEVVLFKRMDSCHIVTFYGFLLEDQAEVLEGKPLPMRKIEVFGDSVSCGEVSEAVAYVGKEDPVHDGEYSNSWYSYAWMTARLLHAQLHNTSQGGIALLDRTGWFLEPEAKGMESCFDKITYHPLLSEAKKWDFSRYTPDVVIIAIGQNDSHPVDELALDYDSVNSENWRKNYRRFVENIMAVYPQAQIILTTTILKHHKNWDRAIEQVCGQIGNRRVHHFMYTENGSGTPGHIRIPEAERMADELAEYILSLHISGWE